MTDLAERPASWMARAVREGEVSAVELVDAHAARIAERDPAINALVLPRLDEAREEAVAADAVLASGDDVGPLHGVPFTAKDPLAVAGMRAPNGSKLLADHVSDADCAPVARMRAAGAILLASENAVKTSLEAIQALGGAGYTKEWPVERFLRDAKLYDIGAGTNEIRRFLIGRELILA